MIFKWKLVTSHCPLQERQSVFRKCHLPPHTSGLDCSSLRQLSPQVQHQQPQPARQHAGPTATNHRRQQNFLKKSTVQMSNNRFDWWNITTSSWSIGRLYISLQEFSSSISFIVSFMKSSDITHNPDYDLFNWNPSTKPNVRDRYHKVQCLMSCQVRLDQSDKERSLGWMQRHLTKPHASGAPIVFWNRGIRHHKAATIINVNTDRKIQWQWSHRARSPFLTMETDLPKYKSIFTTIMPATTITIIFFDNGPLESHSRLSQYIWLTQ